jgi:hypothetical protein
MTTTLVMFTWLFILIPDEASNGIRACRSMCQLCDCRRLRHCGPNRLYLDRDNTMKHPFYG